MTRRTGFLAVLCLTVWTQASIAEEPAQVFLRPFVERLWAISDVILEQHIDPPARQELLLGAAKALPGLDAATLHQLSRRVSQVATPDQFAALLSQLWPKENNDALQTQVIQGMLQRAPGRADWLSAKELDLLGQLHGNRYVGTGIQLSLNAKENLPQIVIAFIGAPARKAGARANDLIVAVDGVPVPRDRVLTRAVEMLRGKEGTAVSMTVRQPGSSEERIIKMIRGLVPFETVLGYRRVSETEWDYRPVPESAVGYLRLDIRSSTVHELRQAEKRLKADGMRALVMDLRLSAGITIPDAAQVADGLLDEGVLWKVRSARGEVKEVRSDRDCLFRDWPMVVLVQANTSDQVTQVLSAALQDNKRAVLVGTATKCEAYVTSTMTMPDGSGTIRMRTGLLERAQPPKQVAQIRTPVPRGVLGIEGHEAANSPEWHILPDHSVEGKEDMKGLRDWTLSQARGNFDTPRPKDAQLAKAIELLESALKAAK